MGVRSVGIVGGGQLARMLFQASLDLDLDVGFLVRPSDEGILGVAKQVDVDLLGAEALIEFGTGFSVVTVEHELTPPESLRAAAESGVTLRPSAEMLAIASNKLSQRAIFTSIGAKQPEFQLLTKDSPDIGSLRYPVIAKATSGGYDGRGVMNIANAQQLEQLPRTGEWMIEDLLEIDAEMAVITVTSVGGEVISYPPFRTIQEEGICIEVQWPCGFDPEIQAAATRIAREVALASGSIGVMATEFFIVEGEVVVNEIAPRVHNSGHLTIEAAETSQFENHLRAVAGMPLGSTGMTAPAAMVNLLGTIKDLDDYVPPQGTRLHLYGKAPRPARKVGHITATGTTVAEASELANEARARLKADD